MTILEIRKELGKPTVFKKKKDTLENTAIFSW